MKTPAFHGDSPSATTLLFPRKKRVYKKHRDYGEIMPSEILFHFNLLFPLFLFAFLGSVLVNLTFPTPITASV
jgi:hypothetical protein